MAELPKQTEEVFASVFLRAYNREHGSSFGGTPEKLPHQSWDYRWADPTGKADPLLVQHTRAGSDQSERVHPKLAGQLSQAIKRKLQATGDCRGCLVRLTGGNLPGALRELHALAEMISAELLRVDREGLRPGQTHGFDLQLPDLPKLLLRVNMTKHEETFRPGVGWGATRGFLENTPGRLRSAVENKLLADGKGIVLAVHFDVMGYDEFDLPELRSEIEGLSIPHREVWGVSLWAEGHAHRLWP